jgi:molybdopterin/thiamine biosynthesis adenylyltransferase
MRDFSRQSFLGRDSEAIIALAKIGIVGLSGGGSHAVQQTAHVGFMNYAVIDPQPIEDSNLNRVVGATKQDVDNQEFKARIAERVIKGINTEATVDVVCGTWQDNSLFLRDCVVIFGCLDSFSEREQLERFCRRFLIPYIDIGMEVFETDTGFHISGQVVLSSPGWACLRCMAIVTEENLKREAEVYGAAGPRPQVVWPNGVLASTAVGLLMQLVTPWHRHSTGFSYLEYNGNSGTVHPSPRAEYAVHVKCPHFKINEVGDPMFNLDDRRPHPTRPRNPTKSSVT